MGMYGMFEYNPDIVERDEIIFGKYDPKAYRGGCRDFEGMSVATLKQLVEYEYADPEESQNYSPTIAELIEFAEDYGDAYTFGGYAVSDSRKDYRVSIDEIRRNGDIIDRDELLDFVMLARGADDFEPASGYAWWD